MEIKNWLKVLVNRKKLEADCIPEPVKENKDFYFIESINTETLVDETLLVYDCTQRDSLFNYEAFLKALNDKDDVAQPVVVFNNWDQEREKYWTYYESLKTASAKKDFSEWFDKKISIYTDGTESVCLEVEDDGINYLEYNNEHNGTPKTLQGHIYNISFYELKKLFNVTGAYLFNNNVRYGLRKHSTGELLKTKFREYLSLSLYAKIVSESQLDEILKESISEIFATKANDGNGGEASLPENFWFYHNGISIFCYDDKKLETPANKLHLPPEKVSVINGAQTLTNFYSEVEFVERNLLTDVDKIFKISKRELLNSVMKDIMVKTVIISGDNKYVRPITYGLNTQIPILEETLLADSNVVEEINIELRKKSKSKIKILKEGEPWMGEGGLSVLDFAKHWLTIKNHPGKSKNLGKRQLEEIINNICIDLQSEDSDSIPKLEILLIVYQWWNETKDQRIKACLENEQLKNISRYGKNYFGTYVVNNIHTNEGIDEAKLILLYEEFEKDLLATKRGLELGDFKKDDLADEMLTKKQARQSTSDIINNDVIEKMCSEIKVRLSGENQSSYTFFKTISHYLLENNLNLDYFRVISMSGNRCKEAFPFPNSTFTEISNADINSDKYLSFDESSFYKEIMRNYPVFIIFKTEENGKSIISDVRFIIRFSFSSYVDNAKEVYEKTIRAFREGDESQFPRMSDDFKFHVRPKAINADDTFEFSNGHFITKRTFWANKDTVESLISSLLGNNQ